MNTKLQELTDKLYNEGLSKGKSEGEQILAKAKEQAEAVIAEATAQAQAILDKARHEAEDLKSKAASDVKMASREALAATKQDIEKLIVEKVASKGVKSALSEADFAKQIIKVVVDKFSSEQPTELSLILPEAFKAELEPFVEKELNTIFSKTVEATFSKKLSGGFTIGPKDGSYFISFSDQTFEELICAYLRPATKSLLFEK